VGWFATLHIAKGFNQLSQIWGNVCGSSGVSVQPYAYPQQVKVLQHHMYVCHGCEMQFERFYSLNHIIVAWFVQLVLAKKNFAYNFNSSVVGTESETKISHLEPLSSNSLSRTQHGKISDKKIETMVSKPIVATRSFLETPPI
jgi:hypothetical protein